MLMRTFATKRNTLPKSLQKKDETIRELTSDKVKMQAEIIERGKRIRHLEGIVLRPEEQMLIVWRPTLEQIQSVHYAARVMKQAKEHTDAENLNTLWEDLRKLYQHEDGEL